MIARPEFPVPGTTFMAKCAHFFGDAAKLKRQPPLNMKSLQDVFDRTFDYSDEAVIAMLAAWDKDPNLLSEELLTGAKTSHRNQPGLQRKLTAPNVVAYTRNTFADGYKIEAFDRFAVDAEESKYDSLFAEFRHRIGSAM